MTKEKIENHIDAWIGLLDQTGRIWNRGIYFDLKKHVLGLPSEFLEMIQEVEVKGYRAIEVSLTGQFVGNVAPGALVRFSEKSGEIKVTYMAGEYELLEEIVKMLTPQ